MEQNTYATITTYDFTPHSTIRVIKKKDTVWFAIEDICKATGIIPQHVLKDIDTTHLGTFITYDGQENIETDIDMISFTRLQIVVARSSMVRARAFLQWVESEIMGIDDDPDNDNDADFCQMDRWRTEYLDSKPENQMTFTFKNSHDHNIRTIIREDGSVWFVAKDVCDVLELVNSRKAVSDLDGDEKADVTISDTSSNGTVQRRSMKIISESGLYALIFKSRKPEAKKFRKWVTSEVLPQIRRTGAYMPCQQELDQPVPANDIPHVDTAPSTGMVLPEHIVSPRAATAFVQAATDTFWEIEKALNEYKAMESCLKKAKKDVAVIIRSAKKVFPDMAESIDLLGGHDSASKLEVEMR